MTAAALAKAMADDGQNVLLVETDTYSVFGADSDPTVIKRQKIEKGLTVVNLRAEACLIETLTRYLPSRRVVKTIINNRVTKAFFDSAPSVNEFVLLDQIMTQTNSSKGFDTVLVDLPASGHAVTFLTVPKTLNGMMRGIGPIAKRAQEIDGLIRDKKRTAIVAVCLPEEMPVNETIELSQTVKEKLGRPLDVVVANMVHEPPIDPEQVEQLRDAVSRLNGEQSDVAKILRANGLAAEWYVRDREYVDVLNEAALAPVIEIPKLFEEGDTELVRAMSAFL